MQSAESERYTLEQHSAVFVSAVGPGRGRALSVEWLDWLVCGPFKFLGSGDGFLFLFNFGFQTVVPR